MLAVTECHHRDSFSSARGEWEHPILHLTKHSERWIAHLMLARIRPGFCPILQHQASNSFSLCPSAGQPQPKAEDEADADLNIKVVLNQFFPSCVWQMLVSVCGDFFFLFSRVVVLCTLPFTIGSEKCYSY